METVRLRPNTHEENLRILREVQARKEVRYPTPDNHLLKISKSLSRDVFVSPGRLEEAGRAGRSLRPDKRRVHRQVAQGEEEGHRGQGGDFSVLFFAKEVICLREGEYGSV